MLPRIELQDNERKSSFLLRRTNGRRKKETSNKKTHHKEAKKYAIQPKAMNTAPSELNNTHTLRIAFLMSFPTNKYGNPPSSLLQYPDNSCQRAHCGVARPFLSKVIHLPYACLPWAPLDFPRTPWGWNHLHHIHSQHCQESKTNAFRDSPPRRRLTTTDLPPSTVVPGLGMWTQLLLVSDAILINQANRVADWFSEKTTPLHE